MAPRYRSGRLFQQFIGVSSYTDDRLVLDVIGLIGDDPGSGWEVAGVSNATKDHTLVRKASVESGNPLWLDNPDTGEQGLEIADSLIKSGGIDVLVIDSVAALVPRAELEGDMGDSLPGLQARLMSQAMRKLTGSISRSNCMVIFINQISKIPSLNRDAW